MTEAKPDFDALRKTRDENIERIAKELWVELGGNPNEAPHFHSCEHKAACYCACPDGPCEHQWHGERPILGEDEQPCGFEAFCERCGQGAMSHSMRTCAI
jgi:hypothetical protein